MKVILAVSLPVYERHFVIHPQVDFFSWDTFSSILLVLSRCEVFTWCIPHDPNLFSKLVYLRIVCSFTFYCFAHINHSYVKFQLFRA